MSFRTALHLPCFLAILCAIGCSKDLRDVIQEYKPKVTPQLAMLVKIRDAAKVAPPVTTDSVVIKGPVPRVATYSIDRGTNVAIEYLEDLEDLQAYGNVPHRIESAGSMNRCAAALESHREPYNPASGGMPSELTWYKADDAFRHCEEVRYVFVVRSLAFTEPSGLREFKGICPKPASDDADAGAADAGVTPKKADAGADAGVVSEGDCHAFVGGYLRADVLVFDIQTGEQLGGFRYVAESSTQVDIGAYSSVAASGTIKGDFEVKARGAFSSAVQKWVPSVVMAN